ncbi:hypothetical protein IAU60_005998 [Kwoniella sp. DSM 27419]
MSLKQPKPLQIRLPFSVPKPGRSSAGSSKTCGICHKRDSRYTCPRCNVLYCSLNCFRSEAHAQCSEPFYKSTVMSSIAADPSAGLDEKKGMMDMLRRFEEAQAEGDDALEELRRLEEEEGEEEELAEMLKGVDLDNIDSNQLFHLLPQKHRDAFLAALKDPDSDLARELVEEAAGDGDGQGEDDGYIPSVLPWWERDDLQLDSSDDEGEPLAGDPASLESAPEPGSIPADMLLGITPPDGAGQKLVYNVVAVCIAYFHTLLSLRLPSLDPVYLAEAGVDSSEVKRFIGQLVPFLVEPKSTVRHESLSSAWGSVWEVIGTQSSTQPSVATLQHLLSLIPPMLHPPIVTTSPPRIFSVLGDLYHLWSAPKPGAVARKLAFYAKALQSLGRSEWLALERQVENELRRLQEENGDLDDAAEAGDGTRPTARLELL